MIFWAAYFLLDSSTKGNSARLSVIVLVETYKLGLAGWPAGWLASKRGKDDQVATAVAC